MGNSFAAVKKLIFEDKKLTFKELKAAMEADWKGDEAEKNT